MNICLVTPAAAGSRKGNRITAERWARFLRDLGHRAEIDAAYNGQVCDLLVALHAYKSYPSIRRFHEERPKNPIILGLTGTDLYGDIHVHLEAANALELATRLVLLQPCGNDELPIHLRPKARVIYQSAEPPPLAEQPREDVFEVCVMGHLRTVKDPFRTAYAAQLLPESSRIKVIHLGTALSDDMAAQARNLAVDIQRYNWLGDLPWSEAMRVLSRCRLLSLTSELEGGANVISEAVMARVPVVCSSIGGSIGLLGDDYPGFFPFGNTCALADLLWKAETDADFYSELCKHCDRRRSLFEPRRERTSWQEMLQELLPNTTASAGS